MYYLSFLTTEDITSFADVPMFLKDVILRQWMVNNESVASYTRKSLTYLTQQLFKSRIRHWARLTLLDKQILGVTKQINSLMCPEQV